MKANILPDWCSQEKFIEINKEWDKIYNRLEEDTKDLIAKAGGNNRIVIKAGEVGIRELTLCFL